MKYDAPRQESIRDVFLFPQLKPKPKFTTMKALLKSVGVVVVMAFAYAPAASVQAQSDKPAAPQIPLIQMQDVPLSVAIENLAVQAEINFTTDPKVTEQTSTPVTVRWENLTARGALERLL